MIIIAYARDIAILNSSVGSTENNPCGELTIFRADSIKFTFPLFGMMLSNIWPLITMSTLFNKTLKLKAVTASGKFNVKSGNNTIKGPKKQLL